MRILCLVLLLTIGCLGCVKDKRSPADKKHEIEVVERAEAKEKAKASKEESGMPSRFMRVHVYQWGW